MSPSRSPVASFQPGASVSGAVARHDVARRGLASGRQGDGSALAVSVHQRGPTSTTTSSPGLSARRRLG